MFLIQIDVQCADRFFEVLPSEVENTEFVVEDLVGHILLEYFGEVIVDRVIINFSPRSAMELQYCSIHIQAHCLSSSSAMSPGELGNMELVLARAVKLRVAAARYLPPGPSGDPGPVSVRARGGDPRARSRCPPRVDRRIRGPPDPAAQVYIIALMRHGTIGEEMGPGARRFTP